MKIRPEKKFSGLIFISAVQIYDFHIFLTPYDEFIKLFTTLCGGLCLGCIGQITVAIRLVFCSAKLGRDVVNHV